MEKIHLRAIKPSDFLSISHLSDLTFGENYINTRQLHRQWPLMLKDNMTASFVIESNEKIHGFRITYLPGTWLQEKEGKKALSTHWSMDIKKVAYFKTALVESSIRGQGWGKTMAEESFRVLKSIGALAVVTHSWNESPGDSSGKYLRSLGFQPVGVIPNFWDAAVYDCVECNNKPCTCTATEMLKEF